MLVELTAGAREAARPLFDGFPGLHGLVDIALEGAMGTLHADDAARPAVALVELDFYSLAGNAGAASAEEAVLRIKPPAGIVTSSPQWEPLLRRVWGGALRTRTRVAFRPPVEWDRQRLRRFRGALPAGFTLKRVSAADAGRFSELADSLVYNFPSVEAFASRGVGFGVEHDGRYVSGCSSFAIGSRCLEFEIQTHPDFRVQGLASACAAAMIEYCLEQELEPCWDAHNDISAALATKLGFVDPAPYTAYEIPG